MSEIDKWVLDLVISSPISPRDLELSKDSPYTKKDLRISLQKLILSGVIIVDKNLKLTVYSEE